MSVFRFTSHLSELVESSGRQPVIIFIYSDSCGTSHRLSKAFEDFINQKKADYPVYKVTVQKEPVLSRKIADWFNIKHESPQVITVSKGKVIYTDHHQNINLEKAFKIIQK